MGNPRCYLQGITFNEFKGKKDPDAVYKTMRISFENENGVYEETVFCPKEEMM